MQYLKAALHKDFCRDRADELHQIKLQMFANMPIYERRQYQQMIRSYVRRSYLDLLDVIPAYVDYLIQQKKAQQAREVLALYFPLMLVWCGNSYNHSQLDSFMMNAPRRLEMIGQLYDKTGLVKQSTEIIDSIIPHFTELSGSGKTVCRNNNISRNCFGCMRWTRMFCIIIICLILQQNN